MKADTRHRGRLPAAGFTLVEVLVALLVMAILAGMAWQGLDVIVRSRDAGAAETDRVLRLNTIVAQWEQDLQALHETGAVPALAFDGQSLRLTRRVRGGENDAGDVALVVWALRGGQWQRWASPPARRASELREAWLRSQQLVGNEPGQLTLLPAIEWQVYFYRGNAWTNAQSTGDLAVARVVPVAPVTAAPVPAAPASAASAAAPGEAAAAAAPVAAAAGSASPRELLPQAVRLVVRLDGGTLTRDVALGPGGS